VVVSLSIGLCYGRWNKVCFTGRADREKDGWWDLRVIVEA